MLVAPEVIKELRDIVQYQDVHAAAANNVLAASNHYTVQDQYEREDPPDARPTFGLDDGETDGILFVNAIAVDGFLTDDFGETNCLLIHAVLQRLRSHPMAQLMQLPQILEE